MKGNLQPQIHQWYQSVDGNLYFEVVAIDDAALTVEIQLFDGCVDEFERESWKELDLVLAFPPEDANAPFENMVSQEDAQDSCFNIDSIEPDSFEGTEAE